MYNKTKTRNNFLLVILIPLLWLSCKRDEEPPVPIGQPIKYKGQLMGSIDSALKASPYTLFYAAWIKSKIDTAAINAAALTIYVPTDSAMTAAGYTAAKISAMSGPNLDSLVAFHAVYGTYSDSTLKTLTGNTEANTLLNTVNIAESYPDGTAQYANFGGYDTGPYVYSLYVSGNNGFWINGLPVKTANKDFYAYRTVLCPINHVFQKPEKDAAAYLAGDPRFTFLMESFRISDSIYYANYIHNNNYDATADLDRLSLEPDNANVTYFAPTNTAFQNFLGKYYNKAPGTVTFKDLNNYQNRVYIDYTSIASPIDSIIDVYYIQSGSRNVYQYDDPELPLVTGLTLYYNDLLYGAQLYSGFSPPIGMYFNYNNLYYINMDFVNVSGKVMLKLHGSGNPPTVNVIQPDITVTNGVIHPVDGFLTP